MTALMLAQTDATGQKINLIVFALVAVAAGLALLTAWYWRVTDPADRKQRADGSGGRRRRRQSPEPDPAPGGSSPSNAEPSPDMAMPDTAPDQTRVMQRSDILEPKDTALHRGPPEARPDVIDLRSEPASAQDETGEIVDLTIIEESAVAEPVNTERASLDRTERAIAERADAGLAFDDWLALAEEDS